MQSWSHSKNSKDVQKALQKQERYRLFYSPTKYIMIFPVKYMNQIRIPIHMDLIMVTDSKIKEVDLFSHVMKMNIGKIHGVKTENISNSERMLTSSRQILWYDAQKKNPKIPLKTTVFQFEYWYITKLSYQIQKNILSKQKYTTKEGWAIYYEAPTFLGINPYNWNNDDDNDN